VINMNFVKVNIFYLIYVILFIILLLLLDILYRYTYSIANSNLALLWNIIRHFALIENSAVLHRCGK